MSRWISSVNKLLDNLDTNVGDVVENQVVDMYDEVLGNVGGGGGGGGRGGVGGESSVDDILAKRGLLNDDDDDSGDDSDDDSDDDGNDDGSDDENDDDDDGEDDEINFDNDDTNSNNTVNVNNDNNGEETIELEVVNEEEEDDEHNNNDPNNQQEDVIDTTISDDLVQDSLPSQSNDNDGENDNDMDNDNDNDNGGGDDKEEAEINGSSHESSKSYEDDVSNGEEHEKTNTNTTKTTQSTKNNTNNNNLQQQQQQQNQQNQQQIMELKKQLKQQKQLTDKAKKETNNANKETRKLRRTVVKINAELDSAERELVAQTTELERAAVRMEKERHRYKEDKDRIVTNYKEDMKVVSEEHKTSIETMITAHAEQMVDMEERIKRAEDARVKEGGDMSIELTEAASRERDVLKKMIGVEEERSTLTSQVKSLTTQMVALQSRLESFQEAAEVASEQEREADDRLDAALSLHARQIGLRQAREVELERTIADIAAALVVARQREAQGLNKVTNDKSNKNNNGNNNNDNNNDDENDDDIGNLKEKLTLANDALEVFKTQVMLERQKSDTLQTELEDISNERIQELSSSMAREKQNERRVSDLRSEVTRLQSKLRSFKHPGSTNSTNDSTDESEEDEIIILYRKKENEYKQQIATLSEDLMRQRGRYENTSTEVLTLRNRLRAALKRAEIAESEAAKASSSMTSAMVDQGYDIERGPISNPNYGSNKTRRRFGGRTKKTATIRSILKLNSGTSETREAIGASVDSLDKATIKTLNYFRIDPFARIFFIVYLAVLHLWVFCVLTFHAHGTLEPSANVGPEQLLKHSYRHYEQVHGGTTTP